MCETKERDTQETDTQTKRKKEAFREREGER